MKIAEAERQRADEDVQRAVTGILRREHCRIPEALAIEIHQAYTGRHWQPHADLYCPTHDSIKKPCPLCPREDDQP